MPGNRWDIEQDYKLFLTAIVVSGAKPDWNKVTKAMNANSSDRKYTVEAIRQRYQAILRKVGDVTLPTAGTPATPAQNPSTAAQNAKSAAATPVKNRKRTLMEATSDDEEEAVNASKVRKLEFNVKGKAMKKDEEDDDAGSELYTPAIKTEDDADDEASFEAC